ncbi:MAG: hypothetical protein J5971_02525 [Prevotella sp.]|nr:hypothetical protein [Prevotella sp.]
MEEYDDIIHLPHYEPKRHPRMPMVARAAQFAPFAAVAGHDAAIREEGRKYFLPDSHKSGGSYQTASGQVKRIDEFERMIELTDGRKIAIDSIKDIQGLG